MPHRYDPDPGAGAFGDDAEQLRQKLETTRALLEATTTSATLGMPEVLGRLAEVVARYLDRGRVAIYLPDEDGALRPGTAFGEPPLASGGGLLDGASAKLRAAIEARDAVVVDLAAEGCSAAAELDAERIGVTEVLLAPLKVNEGLLVGLLVIDDPGTSRPFTKRDIDIASALAERAAVTIEQARLFAAQEERNLQLQTLSEIDELVTSALDAGEIVARGLEAMELHLGVRASTVWSFDSEEDRLSVIGIRGLPQVFFEDWAGGIGLDEPYPIARAVAAASPLIVECVTPGIERHRPVREAYARYEVDLRALVTVPLIADGTVIGGLTLAWDRPRAVTEQDLSFIVTLANRFSSALRYAQLFEAERFARETANQELRNTRVLLHSAILLGGQYELGAVLGAMSEVMREIVPGARTCISLVESEGLTTLTSRGSGSAATAECAHMRGPSPHFRTVMEKGEYAVIDFDEEPELRLREDCDCRLSLVVPLMLGDRAIGTLSLDAPGERYQFEPREIELVASVARGAAIAIENAQLLERDRESARLNRALGAIDRSIHGTLETDEMLARVVVDAAEALGCDSSTLHMREGDEWVIRQVYRFPEAAVGLGLTDGQMPSAAKAAERREPVIIEDVPAEGGAGGVYDQHSVRTAMLAPLFVKDEFAAVLLFNYHDRPHTFTEQEQVFARLLAASLGLALENAHLYEAERAARRAEAQRAEQMTLLRRIADIGTTTRERSEVAEWQLALLANFLNLRAALVMVHNEEAERLEPIASFGLPMSALQSVSLEILDETAAVVRAFQTGTPVFIVDVATDGFLSARVRERLLERGVGSMTVLPLQVSGVTIGTLMLVRGEAHKRVHEEESLLRSIAAEVALGIQNAELFAAERQRRRRIEALHDVMEVAVSSLDVTASAQRILDHLVARHDFELVSLWLVRGEFLELAASVGYPEGALDERSMIPLRMTADDLSAFLTSESMVVSDVSTADDKAQEACARIGVGGGCYVVLPLLARDKTIGRLHFGWHEPAATNAADIDFCRSVAAEVGIVIENTRLYESERDIAETLQETLVVLPAHVPGVAFSRAYESATYESGRVGGDFIDIFPVKPGIVGLSLGDVSGKGIDAAVATSLIRTTLRVHAIDGLAPAEAAVKANEIMRRFTEVESFVTLWFGLLNTATGQLRYVDAGHPPGLVLSAAGEITELECRDPILGAFDDATFFECQTVLAEGDRLVLYSDGATEARAASGEFFGQEGLMEVLGESSDLPTMELSDAVMRAIVGFSDGILRDDAALFIVEPTELEISAGGVAGA